MHSTPNDSEVGLDALEPGLRAARLRRGLSQEKTAALVNASLSSYRRWDRGGSPQDLEMAQALAEALETPIDVIWPPEHNPVVAPALKALRDRRALEEAATHRAETLRSAEIVAQVPPAPDQNLAAPNPGPARHGVPDPREVVRTLDGEYGVSTGLARPFRNHRGSLILAATILAVVVAAGTAIATTDDNSVALPTRPAPQVSPSPAERERAALRTAMVRARDRGDFDGAVTIAARLNDSAAATELRATAGDLLARRARTAADRGDLSLATARLDKADERYGNLPAIEAVRRRVDVIKDAREKRATERKRAAKKRAADRTRADATGQRAASPTATPSSSSESPAPSIAPAPSSPAPTAPKPSAGSGGGSGSSGGSSSSKPVLPDFY